MDDPKVILRNIEHYQHLLTLYSTEYTRDQVLKLLGDAQDGVRDHYRVFAP